MGFVGKVTFEGLGIKKSLLGTSVRHAYLTSVARDRLYGVVLVHVQAEVALFLIWFKGASSYKFPSL